MSVLMKMSIATDIGVGQDNGGLGRGGGRGNFDMALLIFAYTVEKQGQNWSCFPEKEIETMSKFAPMLVGVEKAYYPQQMQHSRFPGRARCGGKGRLSEC